MRNLILGMCLVLSSSCSVMQGAKDAFTGYGDYREFKGRQEVLDEMEKNKEALKEVAKVLAPSLLDLSLEDDAEMLELAPNLLATIQLIGQRRNLRKALKKFPADTTE